MTARDGEAAAAWALELAAWYDTRRGGSRAARGLRRAAEAWLEEEMICQHAHAARPIADRKSLAGWRCDDCGAPIKVTGYGQPTAIPYRDAADGIAGPSPGGTFDWMSNPQYLAQVGHAFGAYSVAITAHVLAPSAFWAIVGVGLFMAAIKEFVFDVAPWGEGDSWADSAMDFAFYCAGAVLAVVLHLVTA